MRNYIFDLDGTLINSSKEVIDCMSKAFSEAKYPVNESKLNSDIIGPPLKQIVLNIAPELENSNKTEEIISNFRRIYDNDTNDVSEVYEGVYDVLSNLKEQGCRLFMATLKPQIPTQRIINQFKLDYFEDVYTIDKFNTQMSKTDMINDIIEKYKLNRKDTVMIGDALSDITAAKNTGVYSIGALWGYSNDKKALIENANKVIKSMGELCLK